MSTGPSALQQESSSEPDAQVAARPQQAPTPLRGILLLVGSTVFFAITDVMTKQLAAALPIFQIAWMRYTTFALAMVPFVYATGGPALFRSARPGLQSVRALAMVASTLLFVFCLRTMPVADATAIFFVAPILIMALSIVFLGEKVGIRRWCAAAVGLMGVLIVIRPGSGAFQMAALLPLLSAASWALGAIVTRKIGGDHPLTTMIYTSIVGTLSLSVLVPFDWVNPGWGMALLGIVAGGLFTIDQWFLIMAYRQGDASVIAPFSYTQLIWAGLLGFWVFGTVPDAWTVLGAGIIVASGLYTAYRERVRALERKFGNA
ncbi:DMT family transporter [Microvirga sp. 2YAF29]|uniref:DMT family transporter n=1 Tax=Microvirga sp. 2YAF29 TaxID=3233031 RepID=UPI003F9BF972